MRPLQRDQHGMSPHLWSVLLEFSALLDEPLSRLLTFILPVCQYCCGGIEFPLSREKKREDKFEIAFYIEEIIFAFDQNTGESPGAPRTTNSSRTIDSSAEAALEGRGGGAL